MKKIYNYILISIMLTTTAGCSDDFVIEETPECMLLPGEYYFVLTTDEPGSRVAYEDEIRSVFETGDQIGVFATNSEKQIQNDVFSARPINSNTPIQVLAPPKGDVTQELDTEIPLPAGSEPHYYFYFPMNKSWKLSDITKGTGLTYSVETDQTTKEAYQKSDFLWNYLIPEADAPYQTVEMHHLMANIIVKIHKYSIDTSIDATTGKPKGVTLKEMHTSASDIVLKDQKPGEMGYVVNKNTTSDILMYCQGESGDYLLYRAAVPAWTEKKADEPIFTVTLFDRNGNPEEVTYKLAKDLALKDGYYYTFTLRSGQKPAIPEVSDDDSWVLDVVDPETGDPVGLLCREYLRFQPDQTALFTKGSETGTDATTRDMNGNATKNINSQAWVFYSLQSDGKTPELSEGIALRFIYDVLYEAGATGYSERGVGTWPKPHHKTEFGKVQQIILSVAHGHTWENAQDENGYYYGTNSREYTEFYLHGAKIIWDGANNSIKDVQLRTSGISDPKGITNIEAEQYGHIAIPTDNSAPHVSYSPASKADPTIDTDGCRIGKLIPRTLHDERKGVDGTMVSKDYPLVKIGFNQFWMSKSLRARTLRDGTRLTGYNKTGEPGFTFGDYASDGGGVKEAGYVYTYDVIDENTSFDPANNYTAEERENLRIPLLYNYTAFENDLLTPQAPESHYAYHAPYVEDMDKLISYFDYVFTAKMSTQGIWEGINDKSIPDFSESKRLALVAGKWTSSNCDLYCSNISGFNLRPMGFYSNGNLEPPGTVAALLLRSHNRDEGVSYGKFNSWNCWSSSQFSGFYPSDQSKYVYPAGTYAGEECISRLCAQARYFMRFKNQQDAAYYGESVANIAKTIGNSLRKSRKPEQAAQPTERGNSQVVYLDLIRK